MSICKVIVIGSGPAGISASIQLKRFGIDVMVLEKNSFGGLLKNANLVENYLGFPEGISGIKLVDLMEKQFSKYKIPLVYEEVINIDYTDIFTVKTNSNTYKSEFLIFATGTKPSVPSLIMDKNAENKVFSEIYPIKDLKNKSICIIGAGDAAFDYAVNLSKTNKVKILNRTDNIKALKLLYNRSLNNPNIEYLENITVQSLEEAYNGLELNTNRGKIFTDFLITATGRVPNDLILTKELKENPSLFMIGDVKNGILRQTAIAVGDGLKAAQIIHGTSK